MVGTPEFDVGTAPSVFLHRNSPSLPEERCAELTLDGMGILDWDLGLSWDTSQVTEESRSAATTSLQNLLTLNRHGGYVVITTKGYREAVIGEVSPPCLQFVEETTKSGEERVYKAFELEKYEEVDIRDEFNDLHEAITNYAAGPTLQEVKNVSNLVTDAYIELEFEGRLK